MNVDRCFPVVKKPAYISKKRSILPKARSISGWFFRAWEIIIGVFRFNLLIINALTHWHIIRSLCYATELEPLNPNFSPCTLNKRFEHFLCIDGHQ
jgi:hypothetical protein